MTKLKPKVTLLEGAAPTLTEQRVDWWAETVRRCKEADMYPDQMIEAGAFFEAIRRKIRERLTQPAIAHRIKH